jgi:hypothetical protein
VLPPLSTRTIAVIVEGLTFGAQSRSSWASVTTARSINQGFGLRPVDLSTLV